MGSIMQSMLSMLGKGTGHTVVACEGQVMWDLGVQGGVHCNCGGTAGFNRHLQLLQPGVCAVWG